MYVQSHKHRFRHIDAALLDLLCLNIGFVLAYRLRIGGANPYTLSLYRDLLIVVCLSDLLVTELLDVYANIERRGYYKEFVALLKQTAAVCLLGVLYLYSVQDAQKFSRLTLGLMFLLFFFMDYACRLVWKSFRRKRKKPERSLLIVADLSHARTALKNAENLGAEIRGLVLTDGTDCVSVDGCPVVCAPEDAAAYVCHNWVDDVLVILDKTDESSETLLRELSETGVVLHVALQLTGNMLSSRQFVESFGGYNVLTCCMSEPNALELLLKRSIDLCAGIVGCALTGILCLILGPQIKRASPGPLFFKQKRVGLNGRVFTMYKFRSMYMDAEERKKELLAANRVRDGHMFKLDFDPRIIGNEILPDGTKKTGIGDFIRRHSLDEFPQFFNLLKGDMSLVGTRPPTVDEWDKYEPHHRARLSVKPGITGLWQVSGRSEITDFEEVVALDTRYINEWSLGLDIKIILKTFAIVLRGDGAL